ncbi:type III effector protein [Ralstonia solanacearum]|nr:type III effector protein [Ralstonia solanacearum P673]MCG3576877.1 type III effector protein [Ralstonia solanacearum]EUJ13240.1 type III effector protein [Ralstonia solanacearum P673]MCL9827812.1 type III effector protein [Ralstonia solanacearum]MCL9832532.1 type III effector protein [Ralstonia solanacearum]
MGGRQAVRPAALADLAKAPVASASANAAGGLLRRAALPTAPDDPGVVLNKALDCVAAWKASVAGEQDPQGTVRSPEEEVQSAGPVMASAWTGLNALATLKMQGRTTDSYADQTEVLLLVVLAKASNVVLNVRDNQLRAQWSQLRAVQADTAETESGTAEDPEPDFDFDQLPRWLVDLQQVRDGLDEIMTRFKSSGSSTAVRAGLQQIMPAITVEQSFCRTAMQAAHGIIISDRAGWLLMLAEWKALPDVVTRVRELRQACHHRRPEVAVASSVLEAEADESWMRRRPGAQSEDRPTLQELHQHHEVLQDYGRQLDLVGRDMCLDAAAMIEMNDADGLWQCMMDIAHSIAGYQEGLEALCRAAGSVRPARVEPPPQPAAERPPAEPARPSGSARRTHGKPGKRPGAAAATVPATRPAPVDKRTDTQKTADTLLKQYRIDRNTVSQFDGDLIRVAQSLGRDTRTLQRELADPRRDAAMTADYLRSAVRDWLGDTEKIGLLRDAAAALSQKDARVGQLTGRIKALERIGRQLDTMEADLLKGDACPRAPHLKRLLNAKENQIRFVSQPARLPAETRNDRLGTLFEMRIGLKPLSDGRRVAPWVVHIHTREPTTADALSTMPSGNFAAVHLKTDWEKNLGPRWEAVMRALGYPEAKVHRGPIGTELLGQLFARVKLPAAG